MKRKEGATLAEVAKATDWQNHSILGFVSGHVIKLMAPSWQGDRPSRHFQPRVMAQNLATVASAHP